MVFHGGDFQNVDVPHFYLDETDFGYESRDEAMSVNDEYIKDHGDEIPTYDEKAANDKKQEKKDEKKQSNSSPMCWGQALTLIAIWILQNPSIILK